MKLDEIVRPAGAGQGGGETGQRTAPRARRVRGFRPPYCRFHRTL